MKKSILAAATLLAAGAAGAADITWALGPTFGGTDGHLGILTNGTLVDAVHLAGSNSGTIVVDPTGLDISFRNVNSPYFSSNFTDPANGIGDAGWSQVVKVFEWNGGSDVNAASFLGGLEIGTTYQVQFFSGRSNSCCATRTLQIGDGNGHFSSPVSQAPLVFQSVYGTFVADATTQRIVFDDSSNNPDLSAYVLLKDPIPPVPEPQTWALMLGGLAAIGRLVRRRAG